MTHRERFLAAVRHEPVDRAVFDLCGSPQTNIDSVETKDALVHILGFSNPKHEPFPLDERVLESLDIDTRLVGGMPTPKTKHSRVEGDVTYDDYGIGYKFINGHYEMCFHPLQDCTIDEMMAYEMPDPEKLDMGLIERWARQAEWLYKNTDYAVIAAHPVLGVFEIGCWMFGFEDYLYRCLAEPEIVHAFSQRVLEYQKKVSQVYYGALGKYIQATTSGDDFGTQTGPFMSTPLFNELIKPYFKERVQFTKSLTDGVFVHHTCGSVYNFIPDLIDCGVDVLNPIQPGVYMMEHERLKADFGDRMAFWGGIDTQQLLPHGTVEKIKEETARILSVMDQNGGYILSPAHAIQPDVPVENLLAVYRGAKEYYGC